MLCCALGAVELTLIYQMASKDESMENKDESMENLERALLKARNNLAADRLDMSFGELMNMFANNELIIDPEFQRYFRWDTYQRTRFIESILLGIPVPSVFMAEDDEGRWEIVDGLQRISTVLSFFGQLAGEMAKENGWQMCDGDIVDGLCGLSANDLPLKYQLNIKRSSLRVEVIKWDSSYDMRYELFNRLNTGGSPLTDQEIRNCIFRGTGNELSREIRELAGNEDFIRLVRVTERQKSELYLDELVLRFYSLLWDEIPKKNLGEHLSEYMKAASENHSLYAGKKDLFISVLKVLAEIGDEKVFAGANHAFSPSKYDGIMHGIAKHIVKYSGDNDAAREKIETLISDEEFISATGTASNYKERVKKRIERAEAIFGDEL